MTTVYGIRHHGPGCARSLVKALDVQKPDLLLIEGPPDADEQITAVVREGMAPPVALLLYQVDDPKQAAFYPFAIFSPEWQALHWAVSHEIKARFFDLPCAHRFALEAEPKSPVEPEPEPAPETEAKAETEPGTEPPLEAQPQRSARHDPLRWLAEADGYSDSERWWNDRVEERHDDAGLFAAILEGLTALRTELALPESPIDLKREAWMRRSIREAQKEGFQNIAVVCGAWHAPVLAAGPKSAEDNALLKGLPKVKVRATWAPWTYERLTSASGYGAGITSPGWYEHLWSVGGANGGSLIERWMTRIARNLRDHDLDASSASVIESVRLAESLAGLRGRPRAGLPETLQAARAIFCQGDDMPLQLLRRHLLVGETLGTLPEGLAQLPLQEDIEAQQKTLRLKPVASVTPVEFDLREPGGQARSTFLHRLGALNIHWGKQEHAGRTKGTFKERWTLQWKPELTLAIIDASSFGNTIIAAAEGRLTHLAAAASALDELVPLLELSLLADLPTASARILERVNSAAATGTDAVSLLRSIPPLARLARYGNVRQSDLQQVQIIVSGLAARVHIALPSAVMGLDEAAARQIAELLRAHHAALALIEDAALLEDEQAILHKLSRQDTAHPQIRGLTVRLLRDAGSISPEEVATHLSFALSTGEAPVNAAAWIEGFLAGGGALLAHDPALLTLLNSWVGTLTDEHFTGILPLLRRTFSTFSGPERGQIGQSIKHLGSGGSSHAALAPATLELDAERAAPAIALVARLLGFKPSAQPPA